MASFQMLQAAGRGCASGHNAVVVQCRSYEFPEQHCRTQPIAVAGPYSSSSAITKALKNSHSIMAAFCRADALPQGVCVDLPGRIQISVDGDGNSELWQLRRSAKRQKVLVGLAHASSDGVFVGTIDHVMVLPELQKQGLGTRYCSCHVWDLYDVPQCVCSVSAFCAGY